MGYLRATYNVTSTTTPTKLANFASGYTDVLINGFSQGRIKEYTFGTTGNHSVKFNYEIDKISDNTFINCPELIDIDIPDNIITIGYGAFQGCSNLNSVTHYNSIAIISPYAFAGCHLGQGFKLWEQEGNGWMTTSYRFPNKVTFIENNVFEGCYFTDFALPDTVESIHSYAFANCPNLHTIYIGSGVTSIEANAFSSCSKLATVVCYSPTAPELDEHTFLDLYNYDGTLYYPVGSDYSSWMSANEYYLGYWDWNSVATNNIPNPDTGSGNTEPDEPTEPDTGTTTSNNLICTYNVTSVTEATKLCYYTTGLTDILLDGTSIGLVTGYTFPSVGEYTLEFVLKNKTTIGEDAFFNCTSLTSVVIPDSVTTIEEFAFQSCGGLTGELVIPDSVTTIDKYAFIGCSGLTSVVIGSGVTTIGDCAFRECTGLTSVEIGSEVTTIGNSAFYGCYGLTSVVIPNSVTTIDIWTFGSCSGLTSVVIGSGCTSIGVGAFSGCEGLTSITSYAPTAPELDEHTFIDLHNYDGTLYYPKGSDYSQWLSANEYYLGYWDWNSAYIGDEPTEPDNPDTGTTTSNNLICTYNVTSTTEATKLYQGTTGFTDILLDGTSIGLVTGYTFPSVGEHTLEFVLKNNKFIPSVSFGQISNLTSVVIPNTVTTIGNSAFKYCTGLTSVTIGSGVTTISDDVFCYCSGLTSVVIPNSVTTIGRNAFYKTGLKSVVIPDSVTSISDAFSNCYYLTTVSIPNSITKLDNGAFNYCYALKTVTIPNSVTSIGNWVFDYCTGLTSVVIGSGVTKIGETAFGYCKNLSTITSLAPTAPTVINNTFLGVKAGGTLHYPNGSDYSSWLSTDEEYLGYYNWNGVVEDGGVGKVEPFVTYIRVPYTQYSQKIRIGYTNIISINGLDFNVNWISASAPTLLDGTFAGYDTVVEYLLSFKANDSINSRTGKILVNGTDYNKNQIIAEITIVQSGKEDEPDEPDIPSQSGETYSPLWKDVFYTFTSDVNDYEIYKGNTLIFKGRAYLPPNASSLKLMVNKICQNYFADSCLDFDVDTISSSYNTFYLKNGNGVTLHTYHFINDWSYKELKLGVKTNPIIPVVVDGQKLFFSALAVNSTYFPYSVRYDGTSYSNNEYIQNDFKTVIMPERTHKNIQSFTVSGTTYNTIPKCRCQYVLYYSNPYGGFDWFPVLGKVSKTDSVVQYTYTNNYDNTTIEFGKYRYLTEITTKYQLNTGFLTEQQSSRMWELMESNCVYLHNLVEDKIYPVLITETEIEHKKKERGRKMLSYTINVETSQTRERL